MKGPRAAPRGTLLAVAGLLASFAPIAGCRSTPAPPSWPATPNVVLILADDQAWTDYGFMDHDVVQTPNLDALAEGGTVFTHGFNTASVCLPSHRTYLGGITSKRWHDTSNAVAGELGAPLPRRGGGVAHIRTLPRELRRRDYVSFEGGKMWEGTYTAAGFDEGMADIAKVPPNVKGDDFGRAGIGAFEDFLDEVGDRPFLAWLAPKLPHTPFDAPDELRAPFEGRDLPPETVDYYANILWLDQVVGEVMDALAEHDLLGKTLVVYAADNGWNVGWDLYDRGSRSSKGTLSELGFRTPIVFSWPGMIPQGEKNESLVTTEDLYATILDYAGVDAPPDRHGTSLRRTLETGAPLGRTHVAGSQRGAWIRTADRRLVEQPDGSRTLYRIEEDPHESTDIAAEEPDVVSALAAELAAWQRSESTPAERLYVAGVLRDADGAPIGGAALRLDGAGMPALVAITDAHGWFELRSLPHGAYTISAKRGVSDLERVPPAKGPPGRGLRISLPLATGGQFVTLSGKRESGEDRSASAERGGLHGTVRDAVTGQPLPGAFVSVYPRAKGADVAARSSTGGDGRYVVENVPHGTYEVRALAPGYARRSAEVAIESRRTAHDVALEPVGPVGPVDAVRAASPSDAR